MPNIHSLVLVYGFQKLIVPYMLSTLEISNREIHWERLALVASNLPTVNGVKFGDSLDTINHYRVKLRAIMTGFHVIMKCLDSML
jgi:hypothetical protein